MKNNFLIIIFLFLSAGLMAQGVKFVATASSKKVVKGDYLQVTFTLKNADGKSFKPPKFKDFHVQGPSTGFKQYNINGKISSEQNFIYTLIPKKIGKFTLPSASIVFNGERFETNTLKVEVVEADQTVTVNSDLMLKAVPDVEESYIGQSITVDFKIYTAKPVGSYKIMQLPDIKGVFIKNIQNLDLPVKREEINGKRFISKIIHRSVLYPQQKGEIDIDPLTLRAAVKHDDFNYTTETAFSNPIVIKVKSLPPSPSDFSGAVGVFEMSSYINRNKVTTDETIVFNVEITGEGDIKRVAAPQLNLSDENFEVYDPRSYESTDEINGQLTFTKRFEYLISTKKEGEYVFEPTFTYFDIEEEDYKTLKITEQPVTVLKGTGKVVDEDTNDSETSEIRYIKMSTSLHSMTGFYGSVLFWILLSLPFLGLIGLFIYKNKLNRENAIDPILRKQQNANDIAHQRLTTAKSHMEANESRQFYDNISKTLFGYMADKLNVPASEFDKYNIKAQLLEHQANENTANDFVKILEICEMALFAGMDNSKSMQETYNKTVDLMVKLEEELTLVK